MDFAHKFCLLFSLDFFSNISFHSVCVVYSLIAIENLIILVLYSRVISFSFKLVCYF